MQIVIRFLLALLLATASVAQAAGPSGSAAPTLKTNYTATVAPSATDDSAAGYTVGSVWIVPKTGDYYRARDVTAGAAKWVKLDSADHPGFTVGNRYPVVNGQLLTGLNLNSTVVYGTILTVKQRITIDELGVKVTTVSAGGNFQIGVYTRAANGNVGTLVGNTVSGSTATAATVNAALTSAITLEPGFYWVLYQQDNTTAIVNSWSTTYGGYAQINGSSDVLQGAPAQVIGATFANTFGTWPSDLSASTLIAVTTARVPAVQFRVSAVGP